VTRALITHAHSDHAIAGHQYYLSTPLTDVILKLRLGTIIRTQKIDWGQKININGVNISFHPAGHIPGSSQIRLEYKGQITVVTGDYKTEYDQVSGAYESIPCNTLVTETTFALPIFQWLPQELIMEEILQWYLSNLALGKTTVLLAYALGKSQRLIQNIPTSIPVYTQAAVENTNLALRKAGLALRKTIPINARISKKEIQKGITIAPSSVLNTPWMISLQEPVTAYISGWMALNKNRKSQTADKGFTLSDHVDWNAINEVVKSSGAENIWLMHGYTDSYEKWLNTQQKNVVNIGSHFGFKPVDLENPEEED
jgi:putative mRNA 3-end processing factor